MLTLLALPWVAHAEGDGAASSASPDVRSSARNVTAIALASTSPTTATATVTVSAAGTFHLRFSLKDEDQWQTAAPAIASTAEDLTFSLTGLVANAYFDVQVSEDSTFGTGVESITFQNRPADLDFALAESDIPTGIAGDASTLWIAFDGFTAEGSHFGIPTKLLAYKRLPEAERGNRDEDKDITPTTGHNLPGGLWSDGTHLYAVDQSQFRVYVYKLSDGSRAVSREFAFPGDHSNAKGIWANSDTFWVVAPRHSAYAYKRTPASQYGDRDTAKDITLHEDGSYALRGLWSDGDTIWAVDGVDRKVHAFDLRHGLPLPELNVPLARAHSAVGAPSWGASGMWGDGEHLWILDANSGDRNGSKVFVYYQPRLDPSVSALSVISATDTALTIRADMIYPDASRTVYLRYREPFGDTWSTTSRTGGRTIDFTISGPPAAPTLVVQASLDSTFSDGTEATAELLVRPAQHDFALTRGTGQVRGIWTDGATLWAVHDTDDGGRVDAYNLSTKAYDASRSFALASGNTAPRGVYANSSNMWVVDEQDKVWAYALSGSSFGSVDSTRTFEIATESGHPRGAWSNDTTLWVAGHVRERVLAYNIASTGALGARDTAKEGALATSYAQPRGMWSDETTLWVVDDSLDRVHAYALADTGVGARKPLREINLVRENPAPWGIASSGNILYVADEVKARVYAYMLPAAPSGDITNVAFDQVGRTTASITVTINNPDASEQTVALKYRALPDGAAQEVSETTSGTSVTFDLTGLTTDTLHALRVSLGTAGALHTPGFKTQSEREQRGHYLKEEVVSVLEGDYPWLGELYEHMRRLSLDIRPLSDTKVFLDCETSRIEQLAGCAVVGINMGKRHASDTGVYVHELGHVYNAGSRYMGEDSEGRGIAWLYFADLAEGGTDCPVHELFAAAVEFYTMKQSKQAYYPDCSNTEDSPSVATLDLTESIVTKEIPTWFDTTYADDTVPYDTSTDPKYDKKYDLEQVWTDVKSVGKWDHAAVFALRNAFGGYCDRDRTREAALRDAPTRNPWRAGGCVPQAPEAVTLALNGHVTWQAPPYDGGEYITAYLVEWKGRNEEYDASRSAEITHVFGTLAYQTPSTEHGSSVRVSARNFNGSGEAAEDVQPIVAPGAPAVFLTAGDEELTVRWRAPASDGGAAITSYDLRSIRNDAADKADGEWTEVIGAWTSGDLEHTVSGLSNGTQYDVEVRAVNRIGAGEWSTTQTGTPLSADATLQALSLSGARLSPAFASEDTSYTASVGYTVTQITVTATENDAGADTTLVRPSDADSNVDGYQVNLSVGRNDIAISVRAANGSTRIYTVTVTRTRQDTSLSPAARDPVAPFPSEAVYTVTFQGAWTTSATPEGVPGTAHFSRLVGAVHKAGSTFLRSGSTATDGVEAMAEEGHTADLQTEVQTAITATTARSVLEGDTGSIGPTVSDTLRPTLSTEHPRVTLVTMIAPSPDWFVGVSGLPLLSSSGRWLRSHTLNLYPWDAGTEEGTGFSTSNSETDPPESITSIRGTGKFSTDPIATLSFALQSVSTTRTVVENTPPGGNIGLPVTATATDGAVTYTLGGADAASFAIVASRGQLRTKEALDYESRDNYVVEVTATDASGSAVTTVTVTVTDMNEPPQITPADDIAVDENYDGTLAAFSARDPENEPGLNYTWSLVGTDAGDFNLSDAGVLAFKHIPDADNPADSGRDNVYDITVRAEDSEGLTGSIDITVTVRPVNEPPVISPPAIITTPGTLDYAENDTSAIVFTARDPEGGAIIWRPLGGADGDRFTLVTGTLRFAATPDYEAPLDAGRDNTYNVTIGASDAVEDASYALTVRVTNREEPGTLSLSSEQPLLGTVLTATLADPDGVLSESWSWQRSLNFPTWSEIDGATSERYTPVADDLYHYLRVTVDYTDGHGPDKRIQKRADDRVEEPPPVNFPPEFPDDTAERSVAENATEGTPVGDPVSATDANNDTLSYALDADPFTIDGDGQIRVARGAALDYEAGTVYFVTVTAADPSNASAIILVRISVTDVNEPPEAVDDSGRTDEDVELTVDVLTNDDDPDEDDPNDTLTVSVHTSPANGVAEVNAATNAITYTPHADYHGADSFTYRVFDGALYSAAATVNVTVRPVNDRPEFPAAAAERSVSASAGEGDTVGAPVTATDADDSDTLTYSLFGSGAPFFDIDLYSGQITVGDGVTFEIASKETYSVMVEADDGEGATATVAVTITVTAGPTGGPGPTGGGGGPSGPSPSELDFEWTVKHDIEALADANAAATGVWSDGETLWVANNPDGAGDGVYAYDLETGERAEEREFELDDANRAPRGLWSDGTVIWVSDSGRDKLFAHDLASGERLPDSDLALHPDNDDPRGIWSDGETMWVLDGRDDALFAYDLASGELLAECALDSANGDPRGLWSDGVTIWVSDDGAKRLFAYRLPLLPEEAEDSDVEDADADGKELERVRDEEFTELSKASNNSPRGIRSDGDVMYVADASDDKVYSYNMPDAIDARLASLTLSGIDIGEFLPGREEYEGVSAEGVAETTVEAEAMQRRTTVVIEPPDADDNEANGHQVALEGVEAITVTVTSADGSRTKTYRVRFPETGWDPARDPWPHCLRGAVSEGFSLVVFAGGSVDDLAACAESRDVVAFYALHEGVYVSYLLVAPDFVNEPFRELFADGLPSITPLLAGSNGPPSADPFGGDLEAAGQPWPQCLRGEIAPGFSLVVFEGGSIEQLVSCAESGHVTALYILHNGEWVSYILGAPEFANVSFVELFPDGLPAITPLVVKSDGASAGDADRDGSASN